MTALAITVAVLTAILYVLLRRARILDPHGFVFFSATGTLAVSRHVPPGQMYVFATPPVEWIDLKVVHVHDPEADRRVRAEARIGMQVADPTAFVRITGI